MKKFTINCDFGGQMSPFTIFIGEPESEHHPLHFQADWLSKERNGTIPSQVMDAIAKLKELADKNKVSLEELCVYALGSVGADETQAIEAEGDQANTERGNVATDSYEASTENVQIQEGVDTSTSGELVNQEVVDEVVGEESSDQGDGNMVVNEELSSQEVVDASSSQELPSQEVVGMSANPELSSQEVSDNTSVEGGVNESVLAEEATVTNEDQTNQQAENAGDDITVSENNLDTQITAEENVDASVEEQVVVAENNVSTGQQNLVQNVDEKTVDKINDQQAISSEPKKDQ
ncbi:hypothetical protein phytr_6420 [Candidatus Phycorickettsia trachydisci]|uniref:DUF2610 domain-containing protein n=1 Tax=Candidatus Phycorickettsia trachydisci TaxID=2115978 RepID=A0A2P1P8J5_9RICK|nr:DUF2610 domain-containing protein [Candidatus Phycorickettsia trachydisci]AVP87583.1 hypothetical protein phytr_6420 [Candidatus Phycorickettsia trachydisci]